jgi:ankyrin repeat protein
VDLTATDYDARSPLHLAASNGRAEVVVFLLERVGARGFALEDRWGDTPLDCAQMEMERRDSTTPTATAAAAHTLGGGGGAAAARASHYFGSGRQSWAERGDHDAHKVLSLLEEFGATTARLTSASLPPVPEGVGDVGEQGGVGESGRRGVRATVVPVPADGSVSVAPPILVFD